MIRSRYLSSLVDSQLSGLVVHPQHTDGQVAPLDAKSIRVGQ